MTLEMKRTRKAQLSSLDMLLALTFVVVLYVTPFLASEDRTMAADYDRQAMRIRAGTLLDFLVNDPGIPANWSRESFETPGLASKTPGELSEYRLWELNQSNYTLVKRSLGAEGLDYNITVAAAGFYYPVSDAEYSKWPNQSQVFRTKRIATINGSLVEVVLYVW